MKTAIYCILFAVATLWAMTAYGQGTCHDSGSNGSCPTGGGATYPGGPGYPDGNPYGTGPTGAYDRTAASTPSPAANTASAARPAGHAARITVVSVNSSTAVAKTSSVPSAKLTLVADTPAEASAKVAVREEPATIDPAIANLVGTWKAVARHGDGELTTVELRLDDRGWAELTTPGPEGKPSTTKSRVQLENQELKLASADHVLTLGTLVDANARQMVLQRSEGQVTFVRL